MSREDRTSEVVSEDTGYASPNWRRILDLVAVVLMIAASTAILWNALHPKSVGVVEPGAGRIRLPVEPVSLDGAVLKGDRKSAAVVMIIYTDFQCAYCRAVAQNALPSLVQEYVDTGKVLLAVRQYPLVSIHPLARVAAHAAECAALQGKFWPMHDELFLADRPLDEPGIQLRARAAGLDPQAFNACIAGEWAERAVQSDLTTGRSLGVSGTPTFFFGIMTDTGRVRLLRTLSGVAPVESFRSILDQLIAGRGR
jgi:protein-disulfide isomerase